MKQSEALDMITKLQLAHQAMESACKRIDELKAENKQLKEALAKQEQGEPVAWISHNAGLYHFKPDESLDPMPLYTTPQQRTWVGLSVFEINDLVENTEFDDYHGLIEAVEAKLKERNT